MTAILLASSLLATVLVLILIREHRLRQSTRNPATPPTQTLEEP